MPACTPKGVGWILIFGVPVTDIATLGIAVDSRQVTTATTALTGLAAAAKPATTNTTALAQAAAQVSTNAQAAATSITKTGAAAQQANQHVKNTNGSLANLSFQINDIGSGLAMGQSPFQIMAQQGGQVFQIWQQNNNVFKEAGRAVLGFLTPMRALGIAGLAVAAGAYAMNSAWFTSAKQFDDVSRAAGTTIAQMRTLESITSRKGIDSDEFFKGAERFASSTYLAKANMGGLADVFRANNVQAGTFTQNLERAADLIKNARDDQQRLQLLQQMGLPATMEWVRFLSQGSEGIKRASAATVTFGSEAENHMIAKAREFDEAWDKTWKNFKRLAQGAVVDAKGYLSGLGDAAADFILKARGAAIDVADKVGQGDSLRKSIAGKLIGLGFGSRSEEMDVDSLYKGTQSGKVTSLSVNGGTPGGTVDPAARRQQLSLEQQYIGLLGQSATALQAQRAVEIQVEQARLNGVSISDRQVETLKRVAYEQTLGITALRATADGYKLEAETVGMSTGQAQAYLAAQTLINDAKRSGRKLTDDQIEAIRREAGALGEAAARAENMRWAYDGLVRGPLQTFRSELSRGASVWDAFRSAGVSALDTIASKLMDMAAQNLWSAAFPGGGGGGLGSIFSGLFGGGNNSGGTALQAAVGGYGGQHHTGYGPGDAFTANRFIPQSVINKAPRFHTGIGPGERAAVIRNDESVLTPGQMRQLAPAAAQRVEVFVTTDDDRFRVFVRQGAAEVVQEAAPQIIKASTADAVEAVSKTAGATPSYLGKRR